ncbi:MAG: LysE family translocator [Mycobacteriaceae bacterium]|nr:LysE family translocator [Mycobacteriaceae bacterium]
MQHVITALPTFLLACLALAALPGPSTALLLHRSVRDGRTAGIAAVAGNEIGIFGWTMAGGAGLSMLLLANHTLSIALHIIGALTLIWLGLSAWRKARHPAGVTACIPPRSQTPAAAFRASLVSIAANPKAAVFGTVVMPQFLPSAGPVLSILLVLAGIQLVVDTAWCVGIVFAADRARRIFAKANVRRRIEKTLGTVLLFMGLGLAVDAT